MVDFQIADKSEIQNLVGIEDRRTLIQKMFFDHDPAGGEMRALKIVPLDGNEDHKQVNDCIPLLKGFNRDNADYVGELKGKDVLVLGGRRKGRAGTGVELLLDVNDVDAFCELAKAVAKAALSAK